VLARGEVTIPIPGATKLPILISDQPRIFVDATDALQNLKEDVDKLVERWQISSTLLRGWIPEDFTKALFADAVDIDNSNMYWTGGRNKKYTLEKERVKIGMLMCALSGRVKNLSHPRTP
jgi:hypothetical protein